MQDELKAETVAETPEARFKVTMTVLYEELAQEMEKLPPLYECFGRVTYEKGYTLPHREAIEKVHIRINRIQIAIGMVDELNSVTSPSEVKP